MADHHLTYCNRKTSWIKRGSHKEIKFDSFRHYTVDFSEQELSKIDFPNYQNYNNNEAYNNFTQIIMSVIDKVASIKERRLKQNDEIKNRDKL